MGIRGVAVALIDNCADVLRGTRALGWERPNGTNSAGQPTFAGSFPYTDMTPQPVASLPATGGDEKDNLYSVRRP